MIKRCIPLLLKKESKEFAIIIPCFLRIAKKFQEKKKIRSFLEILSFLQKKVPLKQITLNLAKASHVLRIERVSPQHIDKKGTLVEIPSISNFDYFGQDLQLFDFLK